MPMKYLTLFEKLDLYNSAKDSLETPNVSYCREVNEVFFHPRELVHDYSKDYLTMNIVSDGTIVWQASNTTVAGRVISYSKDNGNTWTNLSSTTEGVSFNVNVGDKIIFKGTNASYATGTSYYNTFNGSTASFDLEGNIMSLISGDSFEDATTLESEYTFYRLFFNTKVINTKNLILPATTLANDCYCNMFYGCSSLVTAPELLATTLANDCYCNMFYGCSSLVTAPELPATTLANQCYFGMFLDCTSLTEAPELPATTLANNCYYNMFRGCSSLVTAPELPATTLAGLCYSGMFYGCSSLVTAPELPATTLTQSCYQNMFWNCTNLITAPELPATTLARSCYNSMFSYCSSLATAPELSATTLADSCYAGMFSYCSSLATAPELLATTLADSCYQSMFINCTSLVTAPELSATTLAGRCYSYMFWNCTSLAYLKIGYDSVKTDTLNNMYNNLNKVGQIRLYSEFVASDNDFLKQFIGWGLYLNDTYIGIIEDTSGYYYY